MRDPDNVVDFAGGKTLSIYLPPFPSRAFDTFLDAQLKASKGEPVPEIVNISLTTRCQNECWHCTTPGDYEPASDVTLLKTIEHLKEMGTYQFLFTGGNPLLRDDLEGLIRTAHGSAIALVSTPGPLDRARARSLQDAGCQGVLVGLEHYDAIKNDELMGREGAYIDSLETIKNVKATGMLTGCWIVVTSEMIPDLDRYLRFVKDQGVTDVAIFEPILADEDRLLDEGEREYLLNIQKKSTKNKGYPRIISGPFMDSEEFMGCTAAYNRLHITAGGDVYPCDMLCESWGNIYQEDIREIWKRMHDDYPEPLCGCLALNDTEDRLPEYYRRLIRKPRNRS